MGGCWWLGVEGPWQQFDIEVCTEYVWLDRWMDGDKAKRQSASNWGSVPVHTYRGTWTHVTETT